MISLIEAVHKFTKRLPRPVASKRPTIVLHGVCHDCRKWHEYDCTPERLSHAISEWQQKHWGHNVEFRSPRRILPAGLDDRLWQEMNDSPWWVEKFHRNTDIKLAYASSAAYTCGVASLASSSTFVAGRESTAVSNTTNLYLDYLVAAQITVGTTPTANTAIRIYAYGSQNDTPLYPDVLDGTDSAETFSNAELLGSLPLIRIIPIVATTSDLGYFAQPTSLAKRFGDLVPKNHGLFVAHNTGAALNSTAGNHIISYTGIYATG